jgi:hypothetical protein
MAMMEKEHCTTTSVMPSHNIFRYPATEAYLFLLNLVFAKEFRKVSYAEVYTL